MVPSNIVGPLSDLAPNRIDDEPIAPVKILKRPKPQPLGGTGPGQLGSQSPINGTNGAQVLPLTPKHPNADAGSWSQHARKDGSSNDAQTGGSATTSIYDNDEEWPSIADASRCQGSHKTPQPQQKLSVMKKPTNPAKTQVQNGVAQGSSNQHDSHGVTPGLDNNNVKRFGSSIQSQLKPTGPLKTYKERADDYAKARLRILGSAFSEDDQRDNSAFR